MSILKPKRFSTITIIYWFLLLYIIVALVWWFISLIQQNEKMADLLLNELQHDNPSYYNRVAAILNAKSRKTAQYIGEGLTFLILILVGAGFVFRATRRKLKLSLQQQNFMMAVTHELKTPIAVTRLNLETLQKHRLEENKQQKLISVTLQEVNRLNSLCNNILLASQLDAGEYKISRNEVDLSKLANKVCFDFSTRYSSREIIALIEDGLSITGEELLLEMLMSNLVENAIKYSPKNTPVTIQLSKTGSELTLSVSDQGPGIAVEERGKIFDKFYRVGNETTRTAKGTGLGLYLCRQIARDHNAAIAVTDNNSDGSIFTVTFK